MVTYGACGGYQSIFQVLMSFDPRDFLYQIHHPATFVKMSCFATVFGCVKSINFQSCLVMIN